jgi:hypothetical protein
VARQHVFPVCGPGSKTISFDGLEVELHVTDSNSESYTNKDKSISLRKITQAGPQNTNKITQLVVSRGQFSSENEVLIDLPSSEFPSGLLDSIGAEPIDDGEPYRFFWGKVIYSMTPEENPAYLPGTTNPYAPPHPPSPGTVMCVATKNFGGSETGDFVYHFVIDWGEVIYPGTQENPYGKSLFWEIYPGSTDVSTLGQVITRRGDWFTVMYTGTRWVLLGSNNWY